MLKTKFAIFVDSLVIAIIALLIIFIWINKYLKNAVLSFILSNLAAIVVFFLIFKYSINKHKLKDMSNKDLKLAEDCINYLTYQNDKEYIKYFETLLKSKSITCNIYTNNNLYFYVEVRRPLDCNDFLIANNFYKNANAKLPLCFICNECLPLFNKMVDNSPEKFELYTAPDLFELIKSNKIYPMLNANETNKPQKFSKLKKIKKQYFSSITRNHFKDFFISGLSLIIISLFLPYSLYYSILGSFLLILATISLFNKSNNSVNQTKQNLIDLTKKDGT